MEIFKRKMGPQPRARNEACKIKIKKGKDGSLTKSISGNCSKEQLAALMQNNPELNLDN